jgi:hypothetical protein
MRSRWINGVTGSIIAFAIGALFLAGGIYGFAEHSASKVSQTVDWPDWLCIAVICIGVIFLGLLVVDTVRRTRARRSRELAVRPPPAPSATQSEPPTMRVRRAHGRARIHLDSVLRRVRRIGSCMAIPSVGGQPRTIARWSMAYFKLAASGSGKGPRRNRGD